jgi:hypothetical protein
MNISLTLLRMLTTTLRNLVLDGVHPAIPSLGRCAARLTWLHLFPSITLVSGSRMLPLCPHFWWLSVDHCSTIGPLLRANSIREPDSETER